jgi:probable phosphoglycerate mutase
MPRIFVARHGETEWAIDGRHTGRTDIPLTDRGRQNARNLGERLHDVPFTLVLTSPLSRAKETCILAGLGGSAVVDDDLAEWNYGDYEGQRSSDIHRGLLPRAHASGARRSLARLTGDGRSLLSVRHRLLGHTVL